MNERLEWLKGKAKNIRAQIKKLYDKIETSERREREIIQDIIFEQNKILHQEIDKIDYFTTKDGKKLLKDWGNSYEKLNRNCYNEILHILKNKLEYIKGEKLKLYERSCLFEDIEYCFGLPYTSSSSYAGIWNTNCQAVLKINNNMHFRGCAIDTNCAVIFIFDTPDEEYYYFTKEELTEFIKKEKEKYVQTKNGR